jgi:hypothetical protein
MPVIRAEVLALLCRACPALSCPPWSCCACRGAVVLTVLALLLVVVPLLAMLVLLLQCAVLVENGHH